jgi:hypothetical protein
MSEQSLKHRSLIGHAVHVGKPVDAKNSSNDHEENRVRTHGLAGGTDNVNLRLSSPNRAPNRAVLNELAGTLVERIGRAGGAREPCRLSFEFAALLTRRITW